MITILGSLPSTWSLWSDCSKSCSPGGFQTRRKINPENDLLKELVINTENTETRTCNNVSCSGTMISIHYFV